MRLGELFADRTQGRTDPDDAPEPPAHPVADSDEEVRKIDLASAMF